MFALAAALLCSTAALGSTYAYADTAQDQAAQADAQDQAFVPAVSGQEGDAPPGDLGQGDLVAGRPVGGLDPARLDVVQELIEAGTTEDSDFGTVLRF